MTLAQELALAASRGARIFNRQAAKGGRLPKEQADRIRARAVKFRSAGVEIDDIADELRVAPSTIGKWLAEAGVRRPTRRRRRHK